MPISEAKPAKDNNRGPATQWTKQAPATRMALRSLFHTPESYGMRYQSMSGFVPAGESVGGRARRFRGRISIETRRQTKTGCDTISQRIGGARLSSFALLRLVAVQTQQILTLGIARSPVWESASFCPIAARRTCRVTRLPSLLRSGIRPRKSRTPETSASGGLGNSSATEYRKEVEVQHEGSS